MAYNILRFVEMKADYQDELGFFGNPMGRARKELTFDILDCDDDFLNEIKSAVVNGEVFSVIPSKDISIIGFFEKYLDEFIEFMMEKYPEKILNNECNINYLKKELKIRQK